MTTHGRSRRTHLPHAVLLAAVAAACSGGTNGDSGTPTAANSEVRVLTSPQKEEFPAMGRAYFAWSQATDSAPDHLDAYARKGTARQFKVNTTGTEGDVGGIDGSTLVYQQIKGSQSDIYRYDLSSRSRTKFPPPVDTPAWEYHPTISGPWLLFARWNRLTGAANTRTVLLYNTSTRALKPVGSVSGKDAVAEGGQVSGNYAVWWKCPTSRCDLYLYDIQGHTNTKVPNPQSLVQNNAAVTTQGTIYFNRSNPGCGSNVRMVRRRLNGMETDVLAFPDAVDFLATSAFTAPGGSTTVLYTRKECSSGQYDIYKVSG